MSKNPKVSDIEDGDFPYAVKSCLNCGDMELAKKGRNGKWKCLKCGEEIENE